MAMRTADSLAQNSTEKRTSVSFDATDEFKKFLGLSNDSDVQITSPDNKSKSIVNVKEIHNKNGKMPYHDPGRNGIRQPQSGFQASPTSNDRVEQGNGNGRTRAMSNQFKNSKENLKGRQRCESYRDQTPTQRTPENSWRNRSENGGQGNLTNMGSQTPQRPQASNGKVAIDVPQWRMKQNDPRMSLAMAIEKEKKHLANPQASPESSDRPLNWLAELEKNHVFLLSSKKKNIKFPNAKYFCRLCEYHCDYYEIALVHINNQTHLKLCKTKNMEILLRHIPFPGETQVKEIDRIICQIAKEQGLSQDDITIRNKIIQQVQKDLEAVVPDVKIEFSGSMLSGFALKGSEVNLEISLPKDVNHSVGILAFWDIVKKDAETYRDVESFLSSVYPCLRFTYAQTDIKVRIGTKDANAHAVNQLFREYASLDPRVKTLGIAFRYWAKLCNVDNQEQGTLPSYSFLLLLIHFLQQVPSPVVPVLHELCKFTDDTNKYLDTAEVQKSWKSKNNSCVGKLWLEMFKYYCIDLKDNSHLISIRKYKLIPVANGKGWHKHISMEDPFQRKRNVARTITHNTVIFFIQECFRNTLKYFMVPQLYFGPLFNQVTTNKIDLDHYTNNSESHRNVVVTGQSESGEGAIPSDEDDVEIEEEEDDEELDSETESSEEILDESDDDNIDKDVANISLQETPGKRRKSKQKDAETMPDSPVEAELETTDDDNTEDILIDEVDQTIESVSVKVAKSLLSQVKLEHLKYSFDVKNFTEDLEVPIFCRMCQVKGHLKTDCPQDKLPPLVPLQPLTKNFEEVLRHYLMCLKRDIEPKQQEVNERAKIVEQLERYIQHSFRDATLSQFGSSANGFAFCGSDLDICLTFKGNDTGMDLDHVKYILILTEILKTYPSCTNVLPITTAKVPIVKFMTKRYNIDVDLSLYNILALENTKLLMTYANIDPRVKVLGYGMKYFAKLCDIGDASRGSLSSYAYTLMVIYFLQQVEPPVLPVLQELYDESKPRPVKKIDFWNVWFFGDLKALPKVWSGYGKNNMSVGYLWVQMFRFYTEEFDWENHIISIRQKKPLTRLEKMWTTNCIAIEDPFDLGHNLGSGLTKKMNTYIMKALIKGRESFGTSIDKPPPNYQSIFVYLFDPLRLTDGSPPSDRCCKGCGKIGHFVRECPNRKGNMDRNRRRGNKSKDLVYDVVTINDLDAFYEFLYNPESQSILLRDCYRVYLSHETEVICLEKNDVSRAVCIRYDRETFVMVKYVVMPDDFKSYGNAFKHVLDFMDEVKVTRKRLFMDNLVETPGENFFLKILMDAKKSAKMKAREKRAQRLKAAADLVKKNKEKETKKPLARRRSIGSIDMGATKGNVKSSIEEKRQSEQKQLVSFSIDAAESHLCDDLKKLDIQQEKEIKKDKRKEKKVPNENKDKPTIIIDRAESNTEENNKDQVKSLENQTISENQKYFDIISAHLAVRGNHMKKRHSTGNAVTPMLLNSLQELQISSEKKLSRRQRRKMKKMAMNKENSDTSSVASNLDSASTRIKLKKKSKNDSTQPGFVNAPGKENKYNIKGSKSTIDQKQAGGAIKKKTKSKKKDNANEQSENHIPMRTIIIQNNNYRGGNNGSGSTQNTPDGSDMECISKSEKRKLKMENKLKKKQEDAKNQVLLKNEAQSAEKHPKGQGFGEKMPSKAGSKVKNMGRKPSNISGQQYSSKTESNFNKKEKTGQQSVMNGSIPNKNKDRNIQMPIKTRHKSPNNQLSTTQEPINIQKKRISYKGRKITREPGLPSLVANSQSSYPMMDNHDFVPQFRVFKKKASPKQRPPSQSDSQESDKPNKNTRRNRRPKAGHEQGNTNTASGPVRPHNSCLEANGTQSNGAQNYLSSSDSQAADKPQKRNRRNRIPKTSSDQGNTNTVSGPVNLGSETNRTQNFGVQIHPSPSDSQELDKPKKRNQRNRAPRTDSIQGNANTPSGALKITKSGSETHGEGKSIFAQSHPCPSDSQKADKPMKRNRRNRTTKTGSDQGNDDMVSPALKNRKSGTETQGEAKVIVHKFISAKIVRILTDPKQEMEKP